MFKRLTATAVKFGTYAGIGAALVGLVVQVADAVEAFHRPEPEPERELPDSEHFAAGYTAGWRDGRAAADPAIIPAPEGTGP